MAEGSLSLEDGRKLGGFMLVSPSLIGAAPLPLATPPLPSSLAGAGGGGPLLLTPPTGSLEALTTGGGPSENFLEGGAAAS